MDALHSHAWGRVGLRVLYGAVFDTTTSLDCILVLPISRYAGSSCQRALRFRKVSVHLSFINTIIHRHLSFSFFEVCSIGISAIGHLVYEKVRHEPVDIVTSSHPEQCSIN